MKKREIFKVLKARVDESRRFIQVLLGPRQVGKTTLALQLEKATHRPCHYASADLATLQDAAWLMQQWGVARVQAAENGGAIFIIDEIQKIPQWSSIVKSLWDEDTRKRIDLRVMILGSSPWLVSRGLSESLAGRFEIIPITHWSFGEMRHHFGWSLEEYIYFGGYPGAAPFADVKDQARWTNYINDSLIETTISRDILLMTQVNKPALLRRLFHLGCAYSGQILSFSKIQGQLQEAGNTTTLAHYLDLLEGAGLLAGIQKFAGQRVRQKSSSPKFCVFNTALMTAQSLKSFREARKDPVFWGRVTESMIGAHLLNLIRGTQTEIFYWREGSEEVDFVLKRGKSIVAIEVKSNKETLYRSGVKTFIKKYNPSQVLLVGEQGIPIKNFLNLSIKDLC